jgi:hypothetical protein
MKRMMPLLTVLVAPWALLRAQHDHGKHNPDTTRMVGAADEVMSGPMSAEARKHLELSPARKATRADSTRAMQVARELRAALAKYGDTTAAVADGYRMFMPAMKRQRVYHFTNYRNAFMEALRFDPARPTSLLYEPAANGSLKLVGAMYSAPKRMRVSRLDDRIPLSIARWHKHVNWCVPPKGENARWAERFGNKPAFGPESPIATRAACDDVGGKFHENVFGWMIHANVFAGDDLGTIFAHDH